MKPITNTILSILLLLCFLFEFSSSSDTITSTRFLKDSESILSNRGFFELGFFSPPNSTERFVGIWDKRVPVPTVFWVANRDKPLNNKSGVFAVSDDGNLVVLDENYRILWNSNVSNAVVNSTARLLDSGNLVLQDSVSGTIIWESFKDPSDKFLPMMKFITNSITNEKVQIVSWKTPSDPSSGNFSFGIDPLTIPEVIIWKNSRPYWRSGPWDGQVFIGIPDMNTDYLYGDESGISKDMKVVIIASVVTGTFILICSIYCLWKRKRERERQTKTKFLMNNGDDMKHDKVNQVKLQELPLFDFEKLATATNHFHFNNKLGQGGFGPVYKGKLVDGQEIAVKRLSKTSGQGLEEFTNEVMVISKLQHRNLVQLFGCCVDGEERMLVYEYMPNGSLDSMVFDSTKAKVLDWQKRFNVIEGIARGLLYLHRDSRLKIIHRDLKASNILLDRDLNPKISDFGTARIFYGGNEAQARTTKVVGTYGYMSPEYVLNGQFSEKSDVFSFGVLLLETISGRKNTSFYENEDALSLLGFAWKLWRENNLVALIDQTIFELHYEAEIVRCIHVGLLCVQELAKDRPNITTILSMLHNEITDLPMPKQPGFSSNQIEIHTEGCEQNHVGTCSTNMITITSFDGR
ncbi:G-type lectin S-receptor-like serine/threonine-protein kinase At1g11330 isoform X3 [Cucumis melo]|uniref:G-type lectin S-receptor-like serine/threonine-protein kinase At1g11330 isoform X3 n=1 Tax=Cucumis melo TaxID=3656 RepID=A0ABM3KDK1_CUCME|nr:G-type lectin S-receptor-like serine/threonine-protein kinase At1g11330 isoform X3 [Cucumis melo]